MAKRSSLCPKGKKQFEITLTGSNTFNDELGFPPNPPIVLCALNKLKARKMLSLPRGIKVRKVKRV